MALKKTNWSLVQQGRGFFLALIYGLLCAIALWVSYGLRFDFEVPEPYRSERVMVLPFVVGLKLIFLLMFGQFRGLLSYFRIPDLNQLFLGLLCPSILFLAIRIINPTGWFSIPRGVILSDFLISLVLLVGFRVGLRMIQEKMSTGRGLGDRGNRRIGIIGAGSNGASLAAEFLAKPQLGFRPVVFFDDDEGKIGRDIHGIPILGPPSELAAAAEALELEMVAIAIPSLNAKRIRDILKDAAEAKLDTTIIPSLHELSTGRVRIEEMRKVEVEDVLGRDPVALNNEPIRKIVENKVVLVTGAGGSIGAEIVRQVAAFSPARVILVDHSELAVFTIEQEMLFSEPEISFTASVADICDSEMMAMIFDRHRPSVIFHSAAYKHVPLMETQPWEAIGNNSIGTFQLAGLAIEFGVERFVLISTDKAINPTSVMGASKRLAEIGLQSFYGHGGKTRFMAVRFGNVLGSSGSVIPTFRRQIARGGPVTVTHPEVTRYFMTISEAVGLVLQSASMGEGGEIFLLDMGEPVKIIDLARQMILLSGYEPETEIDIEITGLRPGEKLFEELNYATEASDETAHPRIRRLHVMPEGVNEFEDWINSFGDDLLKLSSSEVKERITEMVPEYKAFLE